MIKKELKHELEVAAPADDIWGVYSSIELDLYLLVQLLPGVFEKHEVLEGEGDVGTIVYVKFVPGIFPRWFKEKFVTVDHKKRLKEVEMIEGGYLDMGCTYYLDSIHIIEKGPESCVISSKVTYEVPNEEIERKVAPYISTTSLESMANVISKYVLNKRKKLLHQLQLAASAKDEYWDHVYGSSDSLPKLILKVLPSVFKDIEIVESNDGLGTDLRITIPPGLVCSLPVTTKEKIGSWSGPRSFKNWPLYLMSIASLVLLVFLSSRVMAYKY